MKWKPFLFSALAIGAVFVLVELALAVAGVAPLAAREDPFHGFSASLRVFEADRSAGVVRTRARATRHSFNAQEFPLEKSDGELRIFVLGGSSAYGFPWGASRSFSAMLERGLQAAIPERDVHVVNAAAMSYGSHRLRILTHELLEYSPDWLVLYSGHNEFVEGRLQDRLAGTEPLPRGVRLWLHRWRLYSALTRLLTPAAEPRENPEDASAAELIGFDADRRYPTDVTEAGREAVRIRFEENLRAIVAAANEAAVGVVLCTVPSNERGWRPNQNTWPGALSGVDRTAATVAIERAVKANESGDHEAALRAVAEVETFTTSAAGAWFEKGTALLALHRIDEAADAFVAARDYDGQPGRASGSLNETIRAVAAETDAVLVDTEATFRAVATDGIPGFDLFEDYVHPKPGAHVLIARELWRSLAGAADESAFLSALDLPDGFDYVSDTLSPDAAQSAETSPLLFNLAVVLENQGRYEDAMQRYRRCLELNPGYYVARANLGRLLRLTGNPRQAADEYAMVLQVAPDHLNSAIGLGESFRELGMLDQAESAFRRATEIDPSEPGAWNGLGSVYFVSGNHGEAERAFRRTSELDPDNLLVRANLGMAIFFQGRLDEAEAVFRESLADRGGDPGAMNGMGAIAVERNDLAAARDWFARVLAQDAENSLAANGLAEVRRREQSR